MNISHPNTLQPITVIIGSHWLFSLALEMTTNGNILDYICVKKSNRPHLAQPLVFNIPLGQDHQSDSQLRDIAKDFKFLRKFGIICGALRGVC